ncbi:hypothetical protein CHS0354_005158 [Potamilus streckersoni]|uniref:Uncharacterized protein n=1 Tax=Potamilus streckersoni TaxID=2493646 RepID=A0AAE0RUY1_9BIVA|nr:hypothetical protein CHS0354_005158 [Potamilus streckersoni]
MLNCRRRIGYKGFHLPSKCYYDNIILRSESRRKFSHAVMNSKKRDIELRGKANMIFFLLSETPRRKSGNERPGTGKRDWYGKSDRTRNWEKRLIGLGKAIGLGTGKRDWSGKAIGLGTGKEIGLGKAIGLGTGKRDWSGKSDRTRNWEKRLVWEKRSDQELGKEIGLGKAIGLGTGKRDWSGKAIGLGTGKRDWSGKSNRTRNWEKRLVWESDRTRYWEKRLGWEKRSERELGKEIGLGKRSD